ncbi:KxYKxGKxW signal peptide domain-containing protein [Secundilactobacillus mixtipabuli]|uniref:Putative membrane protein n=1 Tax=Secundilactobacillus mixtipabuli TaxID=1435342 RepID=A0A1Z5ICJ0_9LACO|nr:KxYKxGKxW signal peptide domain-containing protein [Secundilactobacillus mixtipabuli]GAW99321.1 putative membrane protein [Secundilactobacillus mixtipabuli]
MKFDEVNEKHQSLLQDEAKLVHHVKMYKAGKFWIAAGITTVALGMTTLMGVPVASAQVAPTATTTNTTATVDNTTSENSVQTKNDGVTAPVSAKAAAVNHDSSIAKSTSGNSANTVPKVTNLGSANSSQINQAKSAASYQYAQTGQPQVVTAVSAPTPQTAVTGQVTVQYVDEDTQAKIADDYTATTKIESGLVTKAKVKEDFAEPLITGYSFDKLADGDTLNFAPVADNKVITALYKNLTPAKTTTTGPTTTQATTPVKAVTGQVTVQYVDEDTQAKIADDYTATTKIESGLVTKVKVKEDLAEPLITGYSFDKLADGDTLNFAPVADNKVITALYKNLTPAKTTTTGPTTTHTQTTPVRTVTGQVTVDYVDKDTNQPLVFNSGYSSIPGTPTQINGSYTAQTTASTTELSQLKVPSKVAQAEIAGYKFVGNGDTTDLSFVPVGQEKTIKAYYEKLAPVLINYVNENEPADVIFQIEYDAQDPVGLISGDANYNFDYEPTFDGYTYDEQATQAANALKGTGFKSIDETGGNPVTLNIYYKKTTTDPNPGATYLADTITKASELGNVSGKVNDFDISGATYTHDKLPEITATKPIIGAATTINGHVVNQYANYTLTGTVGTNNGDGNLAQGLTPLADYIPNQPVEVVFLDASTGQVLKQESYGDFDPDKGILPSGNYDTGVVNKAYQPVLDKKGYELNKVYGQPTGTYDAMHRIVYYVYTPKSDINYVPVTRVINFTSSDGSVNMNPVTQTVWYKKLTNEVTGKSVYTPQNGYDQYVIPTIPGYSATIDGNPATVVAQEGLPATTGMPTNESVTVNYAKLPPVVVPPTSQDEQPTPPTDELGKVPTPSKHDGTTNVTTDNKVPTPPTEKGGKTTVETGISQGGVVKTEGQSSVQSGVVTTASAAQGTQSGVSNATGTVASAVTKKSGQLPQTNETATGALSVLGAALISLFGLLGVEKKRRD